MPPSASEPVAAEAAPPAAGMKLFRSQRVQLTATEEARLPPPPSEQFDPAVHLAYQPPAYRYSLTELGMDPTSTANASSAPALCDFAVSAPFQLVSRAGVEALRRAVQSAPVQANCKILIHRDDERPLNHWQLRGTAKYSPFIHAMWSSATMNAAVSDAAQYALKPTMAYEMGHTNVQLPEDTLAGVVPADSWHYDANCPFVCIVMLSDPEDMEGGETAIMRPDGSVFKIQYPAAGWAVVMQGMQIKHAGMPVTAGGQRMSMVTSYQAADDAVPYHGTLRGVRIISEVGELYGEWTASRLRVLARRAAELADQVEADRLAERFDLERTRGACQELAAYHHKTIGELSSETTVSDIF